MTLLRSNLGCVAARLARREHQEMQTNRDFAYRTCAFEHGVHNP
jgi:hypothetical protein